MNEFLVFICGYCKKEVITSLRDYKKRIKKSKCKLIFATSPVLIVIKKCL